MGRKYSAKQLIELMTDIYAEEGEDLQRELVYLRKEVTRLKNLLGDGRTKKKSPGVGRGNGRRKNVQKPEQPKPVEAKPEQQTGLDKEQENPFFNK